MVRALLLVVVSAISLRAQSPSDPYQPVQSLGLPPHFAGYAGLAAVGAFNAPFTAGGRIFAGVGHELIRPVMGILGVAAEGYAGAIGGEVHGGARLYGTLRAFLLKAGVEFPSTRSWEPQFTLALEDPITRGGFLVRGGMLRAEWTPGAHQVGVGFTFPLLQPMAGRTRPRVIQLSPGNHYPRAVPLDHSARVESVLRALQASARWISLMTTPFVESSLATDREFMTELDSLVRKMGETGPDHPDGHFYPAEVAAYHRLLHRLFVLAGADSSGTVTALAREVVLNEVLLPGNRAFGMLRPAAVWDELRVNAARRFEAGLRSIPGHSPGGNGPLVAAFHGWLGVIREVEREAERRWRDSRLVWLPLQLALPPELHDTQAEVDQLLERLLGRQFTGGNDFEYLINEAFSPELIGSLHRARDYHVLWVHDFPGAAPDGRVDRVAARVVIEGYLAALTARVREFDATGRLPAFMVFLDQWYFDFRHARWWMKLLADPLGSPVKLPGEAADVTARIGAAQDSLRRAVSGSVRLQALARERGSAWLRRYIKVHVNITYPGDPSFRRRIPARTTPVMFADDYMRDHRKVAFWDLSDADPFRGGALFTGEGVGENYEGARWEDRTLLVRGPAALPLREEARRLLLDHGFRQDELPAVLRLDPAAAEAGLTDSVVSDWSGRLLQVSNATGFGPKHASVLKAALYTLVPAGSRILAPDSQWSSFFWAGMLVGSALRGCQVFVIAPRSLNAPYGGAFVQSVLTHDVLEGYVELRSLLGEAFRRSGGALHVGLYGQEIGTRSLRDRYHGVIEGMRRATFPRAAFPFPPETYRLLGENQVLDSLLQAAGDSTLLEPAPPEAPKLHLKSQLFVSREALERVLRDPGWFQVFSTYVQQRAADFTRDRSLAAGGRMSARLLGPVEATLRLAPDSARTRDVYYLLTGSQNQNDRSLLLDGEIMCLVAGPDALASLIDFVAIAARSTWVETVAGLDSLIPRHTRDKVKLARSLRSLF